jgi:NAD(P)-dependent dehydrogenase (short-subunit alcohol dehydrogenase family)
MSRICQGRVVIVTGAGQGLGRSHALELARQGASVVVNDVGEAAEGVAEEIRRTGGEASASIGSVSNWSYAATLVSDTVARYGGVDALVNNAGIVRDRMLVTMSEQEWDLVVDVDLKGHFCPLRHAAAYWRDQAKAGAPVAARVINTSSGAGLMGSIGQSNYAAAKAGVAALTVVAAAELGRYGVTVNAIAPAARTPMTEAVFAEAMRAPEEGFDAMSPDNVSPLVAWLASLESGEVTGRVFEASAGIVSVADGWQHGIETDNGKRWDPADLGPVVAALLATAPSPAPVYGA